jgi:choloylglycine hydrolase
VRGDDGLVFGRNYDYLFGDGMVLVNPRGVEKVALMERNAARWTSRYGSVTFNQFGKDSPAGGLNERGLVVEVMELPEAKYPAIDSRPQLRALEWIQYLLDNHGSVEEAIAGAKHVRIGTLAPVHVLMADRSGDAAAIEFLGGRMVVRRGDTLPDRVLANSPYGDSRDYAAAHPQAADPLPRGTVGSLERYARAARAVKPLEGRPVADVVEESFRILDQVAQAGHTQWQVVYDLPHATIHFRTTANRERRSVSLATLDFGCRTGGRMLDVDAGRGDVTAAFLPYAPEANERQMLAAFSKSPQFNMPSRPSRPRRP